MLQDVDPNSPAYLAGLRPFTDYIIGADSLLSEVSCSVCFCYDTASRTLHFNMFIAMDFEWYLMLLIEHFKAALHVAHFKRFHCSIL